MCGDFASPIIISLGVSLSSVPSDGLVLSWISETGVEEVMKWDNASVDWKGVECWLDYKMGVGDRLLFCWP